MTGNRKLLFVSIAVVSSFIVATILVQTGTVQAQFGEIDSFVDPPSEDVDPFAESPNELRPAGSVQDTDPFAEQTQTSAPASSGNQDTDPFGAVPDAAAPSGSQGDPFGAPPEGSAPSGFTPSASGSQSGITTPAPPVTEFPGSRSSTVDPPVTNPIATPMPELNSPGTSPSSSTQPDAGGDEPASSFPGSPFSGTPTRPWNTLDPVDAPTDSASTDPPATLPSPTFPTRPNASESGSALSPLNDAASSSFRPPASSSPDATPPPSSYLTDPLNGIDQPFGSQPITPSMQPGSTSPTRSNSLGAGTSPVSTGARSRPPASSTNRTKNTGDVDGDFARLFWRYLRANNYKNWAPETGSGEFKPGSGAHGSLVKYYLNREAIANPETLPFGSVVVMENYSRDRTLTSISAMLRSDRFNPDANDWYWVEYKPDGSVMTDNSIKLTGRMDSCISCHGSAKSGDYTHFNDR